jgi:CPA2 family monovalent cation:H+ antiporter-2
MAAPLEIAAFKETLIVLTTAGVVIPLFRRFNASPVIGFLAVGVLVGPYALGALAQPFPWLANVVITEPESIATVAELGVVLLMFMIGLELSFERLSMLRRLVFGFGGLQLGLCALAIGWVASYYVDTTIAAATVGVALAMSSTAVIVQSLSDAGRLLRPTGRATFAVLLFQDLAAVPILFVISVLGAQNGRVPLDALALALAQAAAAVIAMVVLGRMVLRPLFRFVAGANSEDNFVAATLLVILGASIATAIAGMSMAMGALIAGILLAETEYRRQVELIVDPFKGILLGVFLISVGMSIDLPRIAAAPLLFAAAGVGLVIVKALIVTVLGRLAGLPLNVSMQAGLLLGPGSEFTFVIIGVAGAVGIVSPEVAAVVLTIAATTMATIPLIERLGRRAGRHVAARLSESAVSIAALPDEEVEDPTRVIICGFGRVGQTVATMLETHATPYLAIDQNAADVARHRVAGKPIAYGDATRIEFLRLCGIDKARALVVTLDSPQAAGEIVRAARAERPDLLIVVRARDARDAARLYRLGATDAVPETTEASLVLCEQLLVDLGVPMGYVIASVHDRRAEQRAEIQAMAPEAQVRRTRLTRSKAKDSG